MEPAESKIDEPFGRQPQPVTVILVGEPPDTEYWLSELRRKAEFKGDITVTAVNISAEVRSFKIYHRAVND